MSITLYGLGPSRSFRCLWALEEAQLPYDFVSLDLAATDESGAKSEGYLKINSQGKVPTLVHDDFVLTESAAILNYINALSRESNDRSFVPTERQAHARYDELAFFVLSELEQPLWSTGKHRFALPEEQRIPDMLKTAQWEFNKALAALSKLLDVSSETSPNIKFAIGNEFSFADILLAQTFDWADRFKFTLPEPYLAYRDSMFSRPAVVRALASCT